MKTKISFVLILALLLPACKPKQVEMKGQILQSCDTPAANMTFSVFKEGQYGGGKMADFTTDENGFFTVVFQTKAHGKFNLRRNGRFLEGIPFSENIDLGTVHYFDPVFRYYLHLDVNNPYTELDTLVYYDWGCPQNGATTWNKKISGPFESGIIDTVHFGLNMQAWPIYYSMIPKLHLTYHVNDYHSNKKNVYFNTPFCDDTYQTVTLVID